MLDGGTGKPSLQQRVAAAAEAALAGQQYVSFADILVGLGWVHPVNIGPAVIRYVGGLRGLPGRDEWAGRRLS